MMFSLLVLWFSVFATSFVLPSAEQIAWLDVESPSLTPTDAKADSGTQDIPKKIAVIGSGISGATAALRLHEGFRTQAPLGQQPLITVFEKRPSVGGRFTLTYAYNDPRYPVDTCAATFAIRDSCIATAAMSVGLLTEPFNLQNPDAGVAIWNGTHIVAPVEEAGFRNPLTWTLFRKLNWYQRYNDTPSQFQGIVQNVRGRFDQLLPPSTFDNAPVQLFTNLSEQLDRAQLTGYEQTFVCAAGKGIKFTYPDLDKARRFAREVVAAGERERFFDDAARLSVLDFHLGYEAANRLFISGGNKRLPERLLRLATDDVRTESYVQKIERLGRSGLELTVVPSNEGIPYVEAFDAVVLATSLDLANLTIEPPLPDLPGLRQDYEDSFITHFTTSSLLNGAYFGVKDSMPQNILTVDGAPFFSLTLLRQIPNPNRNNEMQNLFKLISREEIQLEQIEKYLTDSDDRPVITWIDRQPLQQTVPVLPDPHEKGCMSVLEQIEIAPNLYYAGGGEQIIASAEFGCRMGLNAANLVLGLPTA